MPASNYKLVFMKNLLMLLLLCPLLTAPAASFDCAKAMTLVEKAICGDPQLSARDDALMEAYKHVLVEATDANRLKAEQRAWLKNVRNQCQDVGCLIRAYDRRIAELGGHAPTGNEIPRPADSNIVLGRCHMDTCSWWKVERQETIRTSSKGHLVKVLTIAHQKNSQVNMSFRMDIRNIHYSQPAGMTRHPLNISTAPTRFRRIFFSIRKRVNMKL